MADPAPVSRRVSPMDRGWHDRLDSRHPIQCPWRAASAPMSPGWTAFTIRCIAGSSAGAPAPFRAQTARRAVSLRKALALPAGSRHAAACASCASVTASATRPRTATSCAWRRALACPGPSPRRRGMVLRALQSVAASGGQGAYTCDRCARDVGSHGCTWIHRRTAPAGPACSCEGACAPPMRRCKASSSVRLCGPAGGSGQGHAATWEHCAHLLPPVGSAEDTVLHSPQRWQVCGRLGGGEKGPRRRSQRSSHLCQRGSRMSSRRAPTRRR